ncbi:MAG: integrase, partial [Synergistales bacterium]|nr:integrase [Synergistales bacterium]
EQIGGLMRAINAFSGTPVVRCAMLLQAYTATRPGETRWAEWDEFDGDLWRIPAVRMKRRLLHVVPLSTQAQAVLDDLRHFSGAGTLLFPSARDRRRPISDAAVNAGLRRMGFAQDEFTGHSFRSMFSTIANENGWAPDAIERQLAHVEGNAVRAAYNHAEYLPQRREMLQWWADWLEQMAEACPLRK